jgi:predicted nucleotidyltransferase
MDTTLRTAMAKACAAIDHSIQDRVLAVYVIGSLADDTAVPSSDLDVLLVVDGEQEVDAETLAEATRLIPELRTSRAPNPSDDGELSPLIRRATPK